jgi:hypothetical protein
VRWRRLGLVLMLASVLGGCVSVDWRGTAQRWLESACRAADPCHVVAQPD